MSPLRPSVDSVLRVRVSTLRHVRKAARDAWAGVVGKITQSICSDPAIADSWVKFLMLASVFLPIP